MKSIFFWLKDNLWGFLFLISSSERSSLKKSNPSTNLLDTSFTLRFLDGVNAMKLPNFLIISLSKWKLCICFDISRTLFSRSLYVYLFFNLNGAFIVPWNPYCFGVRTKLENFLKLGNFERSDFVVSKPL